MSEINVDVIETSVPHGIMEGSLSTLIKLIGKSIYMEEDKIRKYAFSVFASTLLYNKLSSPNEASKAKFTLGYISGKEITYELNNIQDITGIVEKAPTVEITLNVIDKMLDIQKYIISDFVSKEFGEIRGNYMGQKIFNELRSLLLVSSLTGLLFPQYVSKFEVYEKFYDYIKFDRLYVFSGKLLTVSPTGRSPVTIDLPDGKYLLARLIPNLELVNTILSIFPEVTIPIQAAVGNIKPKLLNKFLNKYYVYVFLPIQSKEIIKILGDEINCTLLGSISRYDRYIPMETKQINDEESLEGLYIDKYIRTIAFFDASQITPREYISSREINTHVIRVVEELFKST